MLLLEKEGIFSTLRIFIVFSLIAFTITLAYEQQEPVKFEEMEKLYVCAKHQTKLGELNINYTGGATVTTDDMTIEFTPKKGMQAEFNVLTPCKNVQHFDAIVESYKPDAMPFRTLNVKATVNDGVSQYDSNVPSCMDLLEKTMNLTIGDRCEFKNEVVRCKNWTDPQYDESDYGFDCRSEFSIDCKLEGFATPIEVNGKENGIYNFMDMNLWVNWNIYSGQPCKYKLRSVRGVRLLLEKDKTSVTYEPLASCIKRKDISCPHNDTVPKTVTTTTENSTSEIFQNLTTAVVPLPTAAPLTFGECLTTWYFLLLIVLLIIQLTIVIVLLIVLCLTCRKEPEKTQEEEKMPFEEEENEEATILITRKTSEPFLKTPENLENDQTIIDSGENLAIATFISTPAHYQQQEPAVVKSDKILTLSRDKISAELHDGGTVDQQQQELPTQQPDFYEEIGDGDYDKPGSTMQSFFKGGSEEGVDVPKTIEESDYELTENQRQEGGGDNYESIGTPTPSPKPNEPEESNYELLPKVDGVPSDYFSPD